MVTFCLNIFFSYFRIEILNSTGGVYLDTDIISVRPYHHLLNYTTAMAAEYHNALTNAAIFSQPNSEFLKLWYTRYEEYFDPDGWGEACVHLPMILAKQYPGLITVLDRNTFYIHLYDELEKIFTDTTYSIPRDMIGLHLWNKVSSYYLRDVNGFEWAFCNSHTLLGKIMLNIANRIRFESDNIYTPSGLIPNPEDVICPKITRKQALIFSVLMTIALFVIVRFILWYSGFNGNVWSKRFLLKGLFIACIVFYVNHSIFKLWTVIYLK